MRLKLSLLAPIVFFSSITLSGQAYYQLKYQLGSGGSHDAFFVMYDNGTGFVRIIQDDSALYEIPLSEQYAFNADGTIDPSVIIYQGNPPVLKRGTPTVAPALLSYWFKLNPATNDAEPWLVNTSSKDTASGVAFQSIVSLNAAQISNLVFLKRYFLLTDEFLKNRLAPNSRGGLTTAEKKTRLLLLIVAQTYDKSIGPGTLVDARNVIETFQDIAAFLGIRAVIDSVFGDRYGHTTVKNAINKLKPASNDIVVFWYSGHGFSDSVSKIASRRKKLYSFIDLLDPLQKPRPNPRDSSMNMEDIYTLIKEKPGRLKLVVGDCCNDEIIPKKPRQAPAIPKPKGLFPKWSWNNLYALFMKPRQSMFMTAATRGESSFTDNVRGSVFTNSLLASLTTNFYPDVAAPDWRKLWKAAQQQTILRINNARIACPVPFQPNNVCTQTPPEIKIN